MISQENGIIKKHPFTNTKIEKIGKQLFGLKPWVEEFGKPVYYLRTPGAVKDILLSKNIFDEWDIIRFKDRWYIFLSSDKIGKIENQSRIKLSPMIIQRIKLLDFSQKGTQRKLAAELGVHEAHISKIRRGISRTNYVEAKSFSSDDKMNLFVSQKDVLGFFSQMLTIRDFFDYYSKQYKIKNLQRIHDMCRNRNYGKLPEGWKAVRAGETWLIYYSDSIT